jgi:tRNase Z endonuclease
MGKKSAKRQQDPTAFSDASAQVLHVLHEVGDHTPSLLLIIGDQRLVFNCGEGFQRCCSETGVRCWQALSPVSGTLQRGSLAMRTPALRYTCPALDVG